MAGYLAGYQDGRISVGKNYRIYGRWDVSKAGYLEGRKVNYLSGSKPGYFQAEMQDILRAVSKAG